MLSRRQFTACVFCAAGGVLAAEVGAVAQGTGFTRTVTNRQEFPGDTMVTLQVQVDIDPGYLVAPHTHPGAEFGYILDDGGTFGIKSSADRVVKPGRQQRQPFLFSSSAPEPTYRERTRHLVILRYAGLIYSRATRGSVGSVDTPYVKDAG